MQNAEKLKPCPFCGGPAVNVAAEYVHCGGKIDCIGRQIKADAEEWNIRLSARETDEGVAAERLAPLLWDFFGPNEPRSVWQVEAGVPEASDRGVARYLETAEAITRSISAIKEGEGHE